MLQMGNFMQNTTGLDAHNLFCYIYRFRLNRFRELIVRKVRNTLGIIIVSGDFYDDQI